MEKRQPPTLVRPVQVGRDTVMVEDAQRGYLQPAENEFPAPPSPYHRKYYVGDLQVGESRFFPTADTRKDRWRVQRAISMRNIHSNRKYTTRKVDGGVRVWRIE